MGGVLQGVAGGISAAQGAMALLGVESETAQQTLLKVQAAMALSTGINSILAMKDAFSVLSAVVTTRVIPAIATTKGLLITSGVGALIAVVATLAYSWSQTASAEEEATKRAEEYAESLKKIEEARKKTIATATETWQIEVDGMKEGMDKKFQLLQIEKTKTVNAQVEKLRNQEITQSEFNQRAKAIDAKFENERTQILADAEKERQKIRDGIKRAPKQDFQQVVTQSTATFVPPDFKAAQVPLENFLQNTRNQYGVLLTEIQVLNEDLTRTMENGAANGIANIAAAIGDSLATGGNVLEVAGVAFLQSAGALAQQLGSLLIGFGVSMEAFKKTFANPVAAIVAGAALIGIGAAVSGKAKQLQSTRGGGSSGGGGSYGGGGYDPMERYRADFAQMNAQSSLIQVDGVVRGNNIVMAVKNTNNQKRRLR